MPEATAQAKTTPWGGGARPYAISSKKFGIWLFIASDSITFASLLVAYSYSRLTNPWPRPFDASSIALSTAMTFCLLSSSLTMVLAVAASARGDRKKTRRWMLATMAGGLAFVVLHATEWSHILHEFVWPVLAAKKPFPMVWGTFFACTGMHMLHVSVGVIYLALVGLPYPGGKFKPIDVEVCGLYWHFVDLVWMFIFPLLYLMSMKQ